MLLVSTSSWLKFVYMSMTYVNKIVAVEPGFTNKVLFGLYMSFFLFDLSCLQLLRQGICA